MAQEKLVSVAALMTAPRHEIVWARNIIESSLRKLGIPLTISGGVFYGQCMQMMLEDVVSKGVNYALTVDFDSVFTPEHVQRLLNIISHHEHIDAIASMQPKRGFGTPLASRRKLESIDWDGKPIKVESAHFGLTVIDLEKLQQVPKPWFWAQPNAEGRWEGEKVDDDVSFWVRWSEAGHSIYVDPGCRLGHLEEIVTVYDEQMQPKHIYPRDWSEYSANTVDKTVEVVQGGASVCGVS